MKRFLKRILKKRNKGELVKPGISLFPELDVESIADYLELKSKGELNGKLNKPESSSESFDEVESEIIDYINREKDRSYQVAVENYNGYYERLKTIHTTSSLHAIESLRRDILSKINSSFSISEDSSLFTLKDKIIKLSKQFDQFKKDNDIEGEPSYADSKILTYSTVLALLLIESFLNGYFFAKGHELGYLGGIVLALLISIVNVGLIGILFGWFFSRQIIHKKISRKIFGSFFVLIAIASALIFNFLVAHYRTAFASGSENPEILALNNFINSPLMLNDMESYFLIIIGCTFCLIASLKFWYSFENYPGYESRHRELIDLQIIYASEKRQLIEELSSIKNGGIREMEDALSRMENNYLEYPKALNRIKNLKLQFTQHLHTLEQIARTLLAKYRTANLAYRETSEPKYWKDDWKLVKPELAPDFNLDSFSSTSLSEKSSREAKKLIKEVYECYEHALNEIKTLEDMSRN